MEESAMKKHFTFAFCILALVFALAACAAPGGPDGGSPDAGAEGKEGVEGKAGLPDGEEIPAEASVQGILAQDGNGTFLLCNDGGLYAVGTDIRILDAEGRESDASALCAGQRVEIGYGGEILESYPARFSEPEYVKVLEEGEDFVGFYCTVFDALYKTDEGLNGGISVLAFDLDAAENLSGGEKEALAYIFSQSVGLEGFCSDFETLCDEGYIDRENLYFETGLLIELEATNIKSKSFDFAVSKWRGGLGAYFFADCRAKKGAAGWDYTIGAEMIS